MIIDDGHFGVDIVVVLIVGSAPNHIVLLKKLHMKGIGFVFNDAL